METLGWDYILHISCLYSWFYCLKCSAILVVQIICLQTGCFNYCFIYVIYLSRVLFLGVWLRRSTSRSSRVSSTWTHYWYRRKIARDNVVCWIYIWTICRYCVCRRTVTSCRQTDQCGRKYNRDLNTKKFEKTSFST